MNPVFIHIEDVEDHRTAHQIYSPVSPISPSIYPEDLVSTIGSAQLESSRFSAYSTHTTDQLISGQNTPGINHQGLGISTWLQKERGDLSAPSTSQKEHFDCSCQPRRKRRCGYRVLLLMLLVGLLLLILPLVTFTTITFAQLGPRPALSLLLSHYGDSGSSSNLLARYPTSFTRDIAPVPIHSHNDFWRRVPLFDAIAAGATSLEVDVWLAPTANDTSDLLVGHEVSALTPARTLQSLYISPLLSILSAQNTLTNSQSPTFHGIYDAKPHVPLTLLVDFKTDAAALWPLLMQQLAPLREKGYLTHYDDASEGLVQRPVTVVVTGNAQFFQVVSSASNPQRDIFFDAPLDQLDALSTDEIATATRYSRANTLYASASFKEVVGQMGGSKLSDRQLEVLRGQIEEARQRGLLVRYWDTPAWPVKRREYVWGVLVEEGVGVLNVDDLGAAVKGRW